MKIEKKYGLNGEQLKAGTNDLLSCAKLVINKNDSSDGETKDVIRVKAIIDEPEETNYYIKKCNMGADASHLLNPNSIWYKDGETRGFDKTRGKDYYSYSKVNENCFKLYLKFLETKNQAYLRNAEREMY